MTGIDFGAGTVTLTEPLFLDDGPIRGAGTGVTTLLWEGEGAAIRSRSGDICRVAAVRDLTVRTDGPDVACLELANVYRGRFADLELIARGDGASAVHLIGTPDTSTHYNRFRDCDLIAPGACVRIDGPANANQFRGGVWSGHGAAIALGDGATGPGTTQFWGVAMQATGQNTGGDVLQLAYARDAQFYGCRIEAFTTPARVRLGADALRSVFRGGTWSNEITLAEEHPGKQGTSLDDRL